MYRIIILTLLFFGLVGCSDNADQSKSERITVTVQMFEGPESEAMIPTVKYWNKNYAEKTGIQVKTTSLKRVGYFGKLEMQLISGAENVDIIHPFSLHLGKIREHLEPLGQYLSDKDIMTSPDGKKLSLKSFLPIALETVKSDDGKIYMLPKDMSEVLLFYRKDLIPVPPATWEKYVETAKKFTKTFNPASPTKYGAVMQGKYEMWSFCAALENLWPYGARMLNEKQDSTRFNNSAAVKGFKVFEELAKNNVFPPGAVNAEHPEVSAIIQKGEVAMAIMWSAFYQDLIDKDKSPNVYDKFEIAPPPGVIQEDGTLKRCMYVQTINLALNKKSKNKKAAMKFMTWVTMGEGAEIYAKGEGDSPGGSSPVYQVWKDDHILEIYPKILPWVEKYGKTPPPHPQITDMILIGSGWLQKIMAGEITAEEAAKGYHEEVTKFLE